MYCCAYPCACHSVCVWLCVCVLALVRKCIIYHPVLLNSHIAVAAQSFGYYFPFCRHRHRPYFNISHLIIHLNGKTTDQPTHSIYAISFCVEGCKQRKEKSETKKKKTTKNSKFKQRVRSDFVVVVCCVCCDLCSVANLLVSLQNSKMCIFCLSLLFFYFFINCCCCSGSPPSIFIHRICLCAFALYLRIPTLNASRPSLYQSHICIPMQFVIHRICRLYIILYVFRTFY